jgi:hypothetical protein
LKRTNEKRTDRSTGVRRRQREKMSRERERERERERKNGVGINADVQMLRVSLWMEKILSRLSGIGQSER